MAAARTCQFLLQVRAAEDDLGGPEAVEEFALALRTELASLEVTRIDRLPAGPAPEGARAVEVIAAFGLLLTAVQTVAALPAVVAAIKRFAAGYAQRRRPVRLTLAGIEIDPVSASDRELEHVVQRLLELPSQPQTGTRSALVVANARYEDERLAQLRSPSHDAEALARVLGDPAIGGFQVDLLADADERTIRRRTATFFADRDRDDVLLLHFSCHGVKDARGRLYLAARDTDLSVLGATGIPASFVNDLLADTQSRRVVLVLDCCYSGAFARGGGQVRAGSEVHVADEFGTGSGRIVLTASSATEYAFEAGELTESHASPSAFTGALVAGLEKGDADLDADGEISIDELYDYTYHTVRRTTPGQAPMKWSFGVEGNLVVARSVRPAALPAWISEDLLSDRVVLRLEAVRGLSDVFAGGKPGLGASAIGMLAQLRDHDDSVRVRRAAAEALARVDQVGGAPATAGTQATGTQATGTQATGTQATGTQATAGADPVLAPIVVAPAPPQAEQPVAVTAKPSDQSSRSPEAADPITAPGTAAATKSGAAPADVPTPEPISPQPPDRPAVAARRWLDPTLVGGALAGLSLLLYLIGAFSDELEWTTANPAWLPELVAVTLLLGTRQPIWAGALIGLLAWELPYSAVLLFGDTDIDNDVLPVYGLANIAAVAALVCLAIPMVRGRPGLDNALGGGRIAGYAAVASAAVGAVVLVGIVAWEAVDLDEVDEGAATYVVVVMGLCALALPLAGLVAGARDVGVLVPVGWLLGGLPWVIIGSNETYEYGEELAWLSLLLVAAVALATIVNRSWRKVSDGVSSGSGRR
jgi:Caspase domain